MTYRSVIKICSICTGMVCAAFGSSVDDMHEQLNHISNAQVVYPARNLLTVQHTMMQNNTGDNIAIINVNGNTIALRCGIIDGTLFAWLSSPLRNVNLLDEYVTVLDLLYIDNKTIDNIKFSDLVINSRKNENRVIFTQLMWHAWQTFQRSQNAIYKSVNYSGYDLEHIYEGQRKWYENNPLLNFEGLINDNVSNVFGTSIVYNVVSDFLVRLREYVELVACVHNVNTTCSGVMSTEHCIKNKETLLSEISRLYNNVKRDKIGSPYGIGKCVVGCLRLIRGMHLEIGNVLGIYNRLQNRRTIWDARYEYDCNGCFRIVPPDKYLSDITHTEQMIDYLERAFGFKIRFIISGKAPCLKCSQYIQYAVYTDEINNTANTNNTQNNANNEDNNAVNANASNNADNNSALNTSDNTDNSNTTSSVSGNVDSIQNSAENDTNQLSNVSDTATPANNTDTSNNAVSNTDGSVPISANSTITNSANNSTNTNNLIRIIDLWNERCAVCFKTSFDYGNTNQHMYPIKVFNANDGNGYKVTKTLRINLDDNGSIKNNTYDTGDFGNMLGINKSNIYAIDNISDYSGQLTMNDDGTVVEYIVNGARYQRSADEPVLFVQQHDIQSKDITLDECESDDTPLPGIQKWWQEQKKSHEAIHQ